MTGFRHAVAVLIAFLVLTACTDQKAPDRGDFRVESAGQADQAFGAVLTEAPRPDRLEHETRFTFLMRSQELERQRFRERGEEFWRDYPQDERRYEWLILAAYFCPSYPLDIHDWARRESGLKPNSAVVDHEARAEWAERYALMRETFWSSPRVSDQQRRLLWSVELYVQLLELRRTRARGEMADTEAALKNVREFLEWLPSVRAGVAYAQMDEHELFYTQTQKEDVGRVLSLVFGVRDLLLFSDTQTQQLVEEFRALNKPAINVFADHWIITEEMGGFELFEDWLPGSYSRVNSILSETEGVTLHNLYEQDLSRVDNRVLANLLIINAETFPGFNQPDKSGPGAIIGMSDILTGFLRYRGIGLAQLEQLRVQDQISWLNWTTARAPFFFKSYNYGRADVRFYKYPETNADWALRSASEEAVRGHIRRLLGDERITRAQREQLRQIEVQLLFISASDWWRHFQDRSRMDEVLGLINELVEDEISIGLAGSVVNHLVTEEDAYALFGLTDTERRAFFGGFLSSENNPELRAMAEIVIDRADLEPGISVSIQAPSLDGERIVDTEDLKGKIVLIDHWDTNCAPCIAAMPSIHEVYKDYQDRGFEVVSIAYDGESQKPGVERLKQRMGLTWETLNGEGLWPAISARYKYDGFPEYMLLDRRGRYVAGTAEMGNGVNLKELLDDLLADEAAGRYERQPAMWKLEDDDTTIYLYGTLHAVKPQFDWLSEEVRTSLSEAHTIVLEVTKNALTEEELAVRESLMRGPDGVDLDELLSEAQLDQVLQVIESIGLEWDEIKSLSPSFAAIEIENKILNQLSSIVSGEDSVESALLAELDSNRQKHIGFVSMERQLQYMNELALEDQIALLMQSVSGQAATNFNRAFQAWLNGDVVELNEVFAEKMKREIPGFYNSLAVARNQEWSEELVRIMQQETGTFFVAVGVGHLVGSDSVQSMLIEKGYTTERVH